jgi:hypothetical protein
VFFKEFATAMIGKVDEGVKSTAAVVRQTDTTQTKNASEEHEVVTIERAKKLVFNFFDSDHSGVIDQEVCVCVCVCVCV